MKPKHFILSLMALFASINAFAYDAYIDGIYYNFIGYMNATVTYKNLSQADYSGSVVIPAAVTYGGKTYYVTSIGDYAFCGCNSLTSITIPNNVRSIGDYAFYGCKVLNAINIPNSVTSIGIQAFVNCTSLTSVTIGNSVTSIGGSAFYGCTGLTSVTIGNSVTSIGVGAFASCSSLTSITIPGSVTSIGYGAFQDCSGLTSITIPNSVTSIGDYAFGYCYGLTSIAFEDDSQLTNIGEKAFYGCFSLKSITIPNCVTSIGKDAFDHCSHLTSVHTTDLAAWCNISFENSYSNPLCYAHHLYLNDQEIKDLVIPDDVTSIGKYAFYCCLNLTSITIPEGVTSIGDKAFAYCDDLTSITIPNSVTSIGNQAFYSCYLMDVWCYAENVPTTSSDAFDNSYYAILHVPAGSLEVYRNISPWSGFRSFVAIGNVPPKYRYYNLVICELQGDGDCIQFSEFDLLDESLSEVTAMNVYAGTEGFDNESWPNVTDNDVHTKYCGSFSGNTYFLFDAMSEIEPYGYRFYTASDTPRFPERNPSRWELYGSHTKLTDPNDPGWEFIDHRIYDMTLQATSYVPYDFYVADVTNKLTLNKQSITLLPNDELQLQVRDKFNTIGDLTLQWTSSNTSVATVNNQGLVVAKGLGSANITVTAVEDNTLKATCTVSVVADLPGHRYYQFAVEATAGNTQIQLSEFDLLDQNGIEITPLSTYAYTGSAYSDNETQEKLFDDDINTKYCGPFSSGTTLYIYIDAGKKVSLSGYRMTTAQDTRGDPGRNPVTWSLLGSNTKSNHPNDAAWTLLDHRENDNTIGAQIWTPYYFFFTYPQEDIITFADANVKAVCVANWDTNGDGELSEAEAAAVTDLGELFRGNTSITSFNELQYFTGLTSIGDYAFRDCIALTSIILPESVTTIKGGALRNTAITTLTIPASVTSIEVNSDSGGVTEDCSSLMNIHVEEGNSRYYSVDGVVFTEDEELVGINGKAIVMFPQGRSGSYEIPSGVTIVGPRAFVSCKSLTSVSIPNFMTNIGNGSFFSCYSLADVWCYAETIPTISSWAFEGSPIDFATLHVPASSLQVYKATTPWKDFGTIIAIDEEVSTETVKIASAADLANFANRVNAGENKLNAVLTADIDFTTYPDVMIENRYYGEFDGRGHSIKLKLKCKGLFCYLSGYVHDLITLGSITTSEQFAGGIASQTEKCTIERCQIKMSISSTVNGDGTHGGIVGVSHEGTLIRDCIFCGSIRGNQTSCCGGLSGWADGTTAISNCLIKSTFSVGATNSDKLARNPSNVISSNNYFCGTWDAANNCSDVTLLTNNQVKSGEACYRLNNGRVNNEMVWYQTLGEDTYPVPDNRHLPISLVEDSYINDRIINFADANVKAICVANWDTNGDGELSEAEAAAVPDLGEVFKGNTTITSFNELQYFTRLTSISNLAFNNCSALKSVTIPNSVTSIGERAFSFCSSLTAITIPNSVMSIHEETFYGCRNMTSVTIGSGVTSIGDDAFDGCSSLTSITIPNNVTSIGYDAFYGCSRLTSVTIGSGVTTIGNYAFESCYSLKVIYCNAEETPDVQSDTFAWVLVGNVMLVVPDISYEQYKTHPIWGRFWIETPTKINEIEKGEQKVGSNAPVYNLSGQRLNEPQKGINIKGGKKIISK